MRLTVRQKDRALFVHMIILRRLCHERIMSSAADAPNKGGVTFGMQSDLVNIHRQPTRRPVAEKPSNSRAPRQDAPSSYSYLSAMRGRKMPIKRSIGNSSVIANFKIIKLARRLQAGKNTFCSGGGGTFEYDEGRRGRRNACARTPHIAPNAGRHRSQWSKSAMPALGPEADEKRVPGPAPMLSGDFRDVDAYTGRAGGRSASSTTSSSKVTQVTLPSCCRRPAPIAPSMPTSAMSRSQRPAATRPAVTSTSVA